MGSFQSLFRSLHEAIQQSVACLGTASDFQAASKLHPPHAQAGCFSPNVYRGKYMIQLEAQLEVYQQWLEEFPVYPVLLLEILFPLPFDEGCGSCHCSIYSGRIIALQVQDLHTFTTNRPQLTHMRKIDAIARTNAAERSQLATLWMPSDISAAERKPVWLLCHREKSFFRCSVS